MADATGYLENDASTNSSVMRNIIFNKLPLLNSPGELIPNTLYYDAANSSVQVAECTNFFGRDRIAFNNKNFGSTPTVHIPNVFFTNSSFVVMELEYSDAVYSNSPQDKDSNFYMPHGWGFSAINNIVYYLGSSSVANIQISGIANYIFAMGSCETDNKKLSVITGAGKMLNNTDLLRPNLEINQFDFAGTLMAPMVPNQHVFRNIASVGIKFDASKNPPTWTAIPQDIVSRELGLAVVPIRLPFSSLCALEKRISFDTKLLQQPIQVTLTLNSSDKFMEVGPAIANTGNLTNSFRQLSFQSFQQGLSDQSLSLRNELLANPRFSVGYPFQYVQDMRFNVIASQGGDPIAGEDAKYFVNITSMLNADLTTIQFALLWDKDQQAAGSNRFAPLQFIRMDNVELLLNGQRLHNYDSNSYESCYNAQTISPYWPKILTAPYVNIHVSKDVQRRVHTIVARSHIYEINFSRLRAQSMEAHMMNTPRFTNQTMQLAFTVKRGESNFDLLGDTEKPVLTLHTTYLYNATFMIGQDGGQSKLVTA